MAELLVRVVDKINSDPYLNAKCTKRGDVIVVQPNGWVWGRAEQKNPEWRIVKIPGLSVSQASTFLAPELQTDPENPSMVLQARAFKLDVDGLPLGVTPIISDAKRKNPTARVRLTAPEVAALKIAKPPIVDPNVFS